MILDAGQSRVIVNPHSTGKVAVTVEAHGGGVISIVDPVAAREIAAALVAAADEAEAEALNHRPKPKITPSGSCVPPEPLG